MTRLRTVARALVPPARVLVAAGGAAALVWAATTQPVSLDLARAAGVPDPPPPQVGLVASQALACPGNDLSGVPGVPDTPLSGSAVVVSAPTDLMPVAPAGPGAGALTAPAVPAVPLPARRPATADAALPAGGPVLVEASGSAAPGLAATQEWRSDGRDLRGLATTSCSTAGTDLWLLAGGAGPGRLERLVLANPGGNPVTAEVTVLGTQGSVGPPRTETVAPGSRVSVLLDAAAGDEASPVVHVAADGAGLHATLTDTWVDGSLTLGAETTEPAAGPATRLVLPGVVVSGETYLRVAVPGPETAVVRATVLGRDGLVPMRGESVLTVPGGSVGDLALSGVPQGTFAVALTADVPIVASALSRVASKGAPGEFGWAAAAPGIPALAGAALPPTSGTSRVLRLVATGGSSVAEVVTVGGTKATTRRVNLLADRTAEIALDDAGAVWVRRAGGAGEVRGSVVTTSGTGTAAMLSTAVLRPSTVTSPVSRAFPVP